MIVLLGLVSALLYGASDFFAGLAARRVSVVLASLAAFAVASVLVLAAVLASVLDLVPGLLRSVWSTEAVLWGLVAGLAGAVGSWALYAVLAIGPMSVLSPGIAAIYAIIPAVFGIALGERLGPFGYLALGLVIVATVLLSRTPGEGATRISPRALVLSLVAGLGLAGYIIAIDRSPAESGLVPLLVDYAVGSLVFLVWWLVTERGHRGAELRTVTRGRALRDVLLAGLGLAGGNILLVIGLRLGELSVMGVLNALYPLGTLLLAVIVLGERLVRWQIVGVVLALGASLMLALD